MLIYGEIVGGLDGVTRKSNDMLTLHLTAHTISQRLRKLRRIPPELLPLG